MASSAASSRNYPYHVLDLVPELLRVRPDHYVKEHSTAVNSTILWLPDLHFIKNLIINIQCPSGSREMLITYSLLKKWSTRRIKISISLEWSATFSSPFCSPPLYIWDSIFFQLAKFVCEEGEDCSEEAVCARGEYRLSEDVRSVAYSFGLVC